LRSGYVGESRYGLLNLLYKKAGAPMDLHYARLSEPPGAEPALPLPRPALRVSPEDIAAAKAKYGLRSPYVALCPGAEYGPAKRWPYFAELSRKIYREKVVLGSAGDAEAARDIDGTNLVGGTSLDEAIVVLAGAAAVVSNDSGLMHVAAALGRPQVALFGSSSPEHTPPHSPAARVLWLHLDCSPCYARECPLGHFRCMKDISVAQVLAELPQA
jgi:heptosyltransferase-2